MGRDFKPEEKLDVERQVTKLVAQATNVDGEYVPALHWLVQLLVKGR